MSEFYALQIGIFLDFPPLLGPSLIIISLGILLHWYITKSVPDLQTNSPRIIVYARDFSSILLVFGLLGAGIGFVLYYREFWSLAIILFVMGRIVEGAILIRGLRKLAHYLRLSFGYAGLTSYRSLSERSLPTELILKLLIRIGIIVIATLFSVVILIFTVQEADFSFESAAFAWSVFISISVGSMYVYNLRDIVGRLDQRLLVASSLAVVGAEIFRYPPNSAPIAQVLPFVDEAVVSSVISALPGVSPWALTIFVVGQIALVTGILLSILLLLASDRDDDTGGGESRSLGQDAHRMS